jgi:hypothetical protein
MSSGHETPSDGDSHYRESSGRRSSYGRRADDYDDRVTINRKVIVIIVAVINAIYLVCDLLLTSGFFVFR